MATKTSQAKAKAGVPPAVILTAVIALIAFVCWLGYANLAPHPDPVIPKKTAEGASNDAWITQKAKESGGDINKLSPEDQAKLQQITRGFGAMALKTMLEQGH